MSDTNWSAVFRNEQEEEKVLRYLDELRADHTFDQRAVALALTKAQEAFMWAKRAIEKPGRVEINEDI